jgi:hypothetical protein
VELRGLEPLTFSLRRLRLLGILSPVAGATRCIVCILIEVMTFRGTHGAHGRIDKPSPHEPRCGGLLDVQRMASEPTPRL